MRQETLELVCNKIDDDGTKEFDKSVLSHPSIRELNFSHNSISNIGLSFYYAEPNGSHGSASRILESRVSIYRTTGSAMRVLGTLQKLSQTRPADSLAWTSA